MNKLRVAIQVALLSVFVAAATPALSQGPAQGGTVAPTDAQSNTSGSSVADGAARIERGVVRGYHAALS